MAGPGPPSADRLPRVLPARAGRRPPGRRSVWWWCRPAEHHIRTLSLDDWLERRQDARRDLSQSLPRLHQIQVVIRSHSEGCQHLVEHRAVLGGHARPHLEVCALPQAQQYRAELDRFGPRAEYNEYLPQYAGAEAARKLSLGYFGPSVTASRKRNPPRGARRFR